MDGFNESERKKFIPFIRMNVYSGMKSLVRGADKMGFEIDPEFGVNILSH